MSQNVFERRGHEKPRVSWRVGNGAITLPAFRLRSSVTGDLTRFRGANLSGLRRANYQYPHGYNL
jgi:hypothetical protein